MGGAISLARGLRDISCILTLLCGEEMGFSVILTGFPTLTRFLSLCQDGKFICCTLCTKVRGLSRERRRKLPPIIYLDPQRKDQPEEGSSSQPTLSTPYQSWATKTDSTKVSPPPGYPVVMSNPREVVHDPEIAVVPKSFDGLSISDHKTAWLSLHAMAIVVVSPFFGSSDPFHSTLRCPQC